MRVVAQLLALTCALATACTSAPPPALETPLIESTPPKKPAAPPALLSIVATNDLHGRIEALPILAGYLENLRAAREKDGAVLLVDAGDMLQGTLESNLNQGAVVIQAYRALGYHAAALGNHEFDFGQAALKARISEARFEMLSANLVAKDRREPVSWKGLRGSVMIELAGRRIGLIGVLTEETPSIVMKELFAGLDTTSIAETTRREAAALREQRAELVVLVAHAGGVCEHFDAPRDASSCKTETEIVQVMRKLGHGVVDVVLAGHTHQAMAHFIEDTPVVEAYAYGRAFSRVDVRFGAARPEIEVQRPRDLCPAQQKLAECQPGSYEGRAVERDEKIAALIAPALERAAGKRREKIGIHLSAEVGASFTDPSALGNLFADLLREAVAGADLGLMNGGGVRAPLPAGPLEYGALHEAMPFDNRLAVVKLTAAELEQVIAAHLASDRHGIISISGAVVRGRCKGGKLTVELLRKGKPLKDDAMLRVVISDYLATGGDDLLAPAKPAPDRIQILPELLREAFARRLKARGGDLDASRVEQRLQLPGKRPLSCK